MPADLPFPASSRLPRPAPGGPDGATPGGGDPEHRTPATGEIIWESDGVGPADGAPTGGPAHHGRPADQDRRTVRVAWAADAPAVAAVQHADLGRALAATGVEVPTAAELEPVWLRAITRPPTARHRVFVAVEADRVRGFVATGPAEDPDSDVAVDGDVPALHAVRDAMRADLPDTPLGGADELLGALVAAAADALAADGFSRAQLWVHTTDNLLRRVLDDAGWTPDGASRTLADEGDRADRADDAAQGAALKQVRLHVGLA